MSLGKPIFIHEIRSKCIGHLFVYSPTARDVCSWQRMAGLLIASAYW